MATSLKRNTVGYLPYGGVYERMRSGVLSSPASGGSFERYPEWPAPSGTEVDPLWGDVILLSSFEGDNGDTSMVDDSPYSAAILGNSGIKLSDAQSRFGNSSLAVTETSFNPGIIVTGPQFDLTFSEPFCMECWVYHNLSPNKTSAPLIMRYSRPASNEYDQVVNYANSAQHQYLNDDFGDETPPTAYSSDAWHHVAVDFDGATLRYFFDGALLYSTPRSHLVAAGNTFYIGGFNGGGSVANGVFFIDELRVTKASRYTAGFTPRTSPFPRG